MEDQLFLLTSVPGWKIVLGHYAEEADSTSTLQTESTPGRIKNWSTRRQLAISPEGEDEPSTLDELSEQENSQAHGMLIALDLLEIDLVNRQDGLGYRLTSLGKKLLQNPNLVEAESAESASDAPQSLLDDDDSMAA
jgi:hypothetical protein